MTMGISLANSSPLPRPSAVISVRPGGGAGSVGWLAGSMTFTPFAMSPKVGDQLSLNIYYDRNGHTIFTAVDKTQGITRTGRASTSNVIYNEVPLFGGVPASVPSPASDIRLWKVANVAETTYTGVHGTVTGPWQTRRVIQTSTGTATGTVITSPNGLWNGGANFGIYLRHR
jgi:hypothetical protein